MERSDRRRTPRVDTDLTGNLGESETMSCRVANLSKSGALAISTHPVAEMSQVRIRIQVPQADDTTTEFACEAAVVRCARRSDGAYDLGLFFTSLGEDARRALESALAAGSICPAP